MVLASLSQQIPQAYSPEDIEALAASKALQFASEIGIREAVLEGDSQVLMPRLINDTEVMSYNALLIEDVQRCSRSFNQLCYSHVTREDNKITHRLTRYVVHIPDFIMWMEDILPQFISVLQACKVELIQLCVSFIPCQICL